MLTIVSPLRLKIELGVLPWLKTIIGKRAGSSLIQDQIGQKLLDLSFVLPLHDGHNDLNQGSRTRRALDGQPTAEEPHPLPNALQAKVPFLNRLRVEPNPPVPHFQPNILPLLSHGDRHLLALAVLAGIGQRFLRDAVKGVLQDRRQSAKLHAAMAFDLRASMSPLFVNQMRDCRLDPDLRR